MVVNRCKIILLTSCILAQPKKQKLEEFKTKSSNKLASLLKDLQSDDTSINQTEYDLSRKRVFRRPVLGEDSLNITSTDGDRVFLKLHPDDDNSKEEVTNNCTGNSQLKIRLLIDH